MPSGHGGGGHFGGGSRSHSSHSGGHFGGSHSSGGARSYRPTMRWRPRTMVFLGRPVYLSSGRTGAISILGLFIVIAAIIALFFGIGWLNVNDTLKTIKDDYDFYHQMAEYALEHPAYQVLADYVDYEQYDYSGKYCVWYQVLDDDGQVQIYGYSFYVYSYSDIQRMQKEGVLLAVDDDDIKWVLESVPLDYAYTTLDDDAEYLDYLENRNLSRTLTLVMVGVIAVMIVAAVLVPLTAQRATKEQIAESNNANGNANAGSQNSADTGTWRCVYCNALNDSSRQTCDGCGAKRQK